MQRRIIALAAGMALGLGLAAPALAEDTLVASGDATSITDTSADLNGVVYRDGVGARWLFEYSTSRSFSGTVLSTPALATSARVTAVERRVTALSPGTTYYWRTVIVTRSGTRTVQSFATTKTLQTLAATTPAPAAVTSTAATATTAAPAPTPQAAARR